MPGKSHDPVRRADVQSRWYRRKYTREDRELREDADAVVKELNSLVPRPAAEIPTREKEPARSARTVAAFTRESKKRAAKVQATLDKLEAVNKKRFEERLAQIAKAKHQGYSGNLNLSRR